MPPASVKQTAVEVWEERKDEENMTEATSGQVNYLCKGMKNKQSNLLNIKPLIKYTDAPLFEAYYPFFMGMKLVGLFHSKEYVVKPQQYRWLKKSG